MLTVGRLVLAVLGLVVTLVATQYATARVIDRDWCARRTPSGHQPFFEPHTSPVAPWVRCTYERTGPPAGPRESVTLVTEFSSWTPPAITMAGLGVAVGSGEIARRRVRSRP